MRRVGVLLLIFAATGWANGGAYVAEVMAGMGTGIACAAGAGYALRGADADAVTANIGIAAGYIGGTTAGVFLVGEGLDGRSANPPAPFFGALGGAALGSTLGGGLLVLGIVVADNGNLAAGYPLFLLGFAVAVGGTPVLSATLYNALKKPTEPDLGGLTVTPTIAALPPRTPGEAPTLTFGLAASF